MWLWNPFLPVSSTRPRLPPLAEVTRHRLLLCLGFSTPPQVILSSPRAHTHMDARTACTIICNMCVHKHTHGHLHVQACMRIIHVDVHMHTRACAQTCTHVGTCTHTHAWHSKSSETAARFHCRRQGTTLATEGPLAVESAVSPRCCSPSASAGPRAASPVREVG